MLTFELTFQQLQPNLSFLPEITAISVHNHLQNISSYKTLKSALIYFDVLLTDQLIDIDSHSYLCIYARRQYYIAML